MFDSKGHHFKYVVLGEKVGVRWTRQTIFRHEVKREQFRTNSALAYSCMMNYEGKANLFIKFPTKYYVYSYRITTSLLRSFNPSL